MSMQFHPIDRGAGVDNAAAAGLGTGSPLPHVAQRIRRDKLRFPPATADDATMLPLPYGYDNDAAFPPPLDTYGARASAADLGYLNAVVAPPTARSAAGADQWPTPQNGASPWAHPKLEQVNYMEYEAARAGFTAQHQGAALSLTLHSPAPANGGSLQSVVGAAAAGPLGPFTGYAAVLKGSRFLRPAQQMLDEICAALVGEERSRWNAGTGGSCSLVSPSPTLMSSTTEDGNRQYQRPEFREMKAKLLYMQEEVCRRYKQYHHQMQMVVSSFEPIPGLSSGTPFASSVLKAVSGHFRRVRSIISNQIQYISRLLGDELLSLPRGGKAMAEQSKPVWRPQRGLPERAVSVLRAWLFEHFLHPYPTDGDKHMLATQTGLSRNQVSNWFINARVRLWKPMVEEIHTLETRVSASANAMVASSSDRVTTPPVGVGNQQQHQYGQRLQEQQHCQYAAPPLTGVEADSGGGQGQGPMSFAGGVALSDIGGGFGAGAVSLMLGLRRDASYQYQHQFGGNILGDLVG